jgi:DNA end-binding protein Ku
MWTGSLSFGLVNVPVQLVTAVRDVSIRFRQLHKKTHRPIEVRRFCSEENVEVPWDEVAHGYETEDGDMIVVTDEDLDQVAPRMTRTVDIEAFVPLEDVDPIYFNHPYVLLPMGDSEGTLRAYQLLVEVMKSTERAALGRFVMRTKEYLVLVRAKDDRLSLVTLLWHDEVRPTKDMAPSGKAKKDAVEQTVALIEGLSEDWDPERYEDRYRMRLEEVIESKRKGGTVKAPTPEKEPTATPDLMAALEESLSKLKTTSLADLSKKELLERAADEDVEGRSKMSKDELVDALS